MAINLSNEIVNTIATETLMQAVDKMSGSAFNLSTNYHKGDAIQENSFLELSNLMSDRDPDGTNVLTDKELSTGEISMSKAYFTTGSVGINRSTMLRYGHSTDAFSAVVGEQYGKALLVYMLNRGLLAVATAIQTNSGMVYGDGTGALDYGFLNGMNALFGDASSMLATNIGTGAEWHALVGASIAKDIDTVGGMAILSGDAGSLGRDFMVTDSASLDLTAGKWAVLALVAGAIKLQESENRDILLEKYGGKENIRFRFQAEGAFDVGVLGYNFDNTLPATATNVGTGANWTKISTDDKSTAGVLGSILRP